jgi:hypothetical protein
VITGVDGAKGATGQATLSKVLVAFDDFTIRQDGEKTPHLEGKGLVVTATGPTELDRPPSSLDVVVDLPESKIPDLRVYSQYLPTGAGIAIEGGTGKAKAHLEVGAVDRIGHGTIDLVTNDAKVKVDDVLGELRGTRKVATAIRFGLREEKELLRSPMRVRPHPTVQWREDAVDALVTAGHRRRTLARKSRRV